MKHQSDTAEAARNFGQRAKRGRVRMTSAERREQLIEVARGLFAANGFEGTTVEEIAQHAQVSKPVVYEHFGGKEGLYAEVIQRDSTALHDAIVTALSRPGAHTRVLVEAGAMALLDYIDAHPEGFRILSRDSAPEGHQTYASLLSDIAAKVSFLLVEAFERYGHDPALAPVYAQALVGLVSQAGQAWLDTRHPSKEIVAAHVVNLTWNGMRGLESNPQLLTMHRGERLSSAD